MKQSDPQSLTQPASANSERDTSRSTSHDARRSVPKADIILAAVVPAAAVTAPFLIIGLGSSWTTSIILIGVVEAILLRFGLRQLNKYTARKLRPAYAKASPRWPSRAVSQRELRDFQYQITVHLQRQSFTEPQNRLFALSLIHPPAIRRRCTDQFEVKGRVLAHETSLEFDLDVTSLAEPGTSSGNNSDSEEAYTPNDSLADDLRDQPKYVAVLLLEKGVLHDYSRFSDSKGEAVSALSYKEYRLLAGLTIRRLLIAAFDGYDSIPDEAWDVESSCFELLLQFGVIDQGPDTTDTRVENVITRLQQLAALVDEQGQNYLDLLMGLVRVIARHYAVVAVLPGETPPRFFLTYQSIEVPSVQRPDASPLAKLRLWLGAAPLTLELSAGNASTCQSYHLLAGGPEDRYLADFRTPFIPHNTDAQVPSDSRVTYYRVRGRRGQAYFHLYCRPGDDLDVRSLKIRLWFLEVPPGSIGRAALSALVSFATCFAVAWASSLLGTTAGSTESMVDGNVAIFLLALPGLAAAWLGFDASQPRLVGLVEAPLAAIVSLFCTFITSLGATILLLFQKTGVIPPSLSMLAGVPHPLWYFFISIAAINATVLLGILLQRVEYYRTIIFRPTATSGYVYYY